MDILLIGYGKMGKLIHTLAEQRGHQVVKIIDVTNENELDEIADLRNLNIDVAIEFTQPEAAVKHIETCLKAGIPIVCGTTGWYDQLSEVTALCHENNGALLYASNFSIGVHLFWKMASSFAGLMDGFPEYLPRIEEWHHIHKLDAPSGTAITTAQKLMFSLSRYRSWNRMVQGLQPEGSIPIESYREGEIPGTHRIVFTSEVDQIALEHKAFNRQGFVAGAVMAAEWLPGHPGIFGIEDMLDAPPGEA